GSERAYEALGGVADHKVVAPLGEQPGQVRPHVGRGVAHDCHSPAHRVRSSRARTSARTPTPVGGPRAGGSRLPWCWDTCDGAVRPLCAPWLSDGICPCDLCRTTALTPARSCRRRRKPAELGVPVAAPAP